jgi:hypothetical protein
MTEEKNPKSVLAADDFIVKEPEALRMLPVAST